MRQILILILGIATVGDAQRRSLRVHTANEAGSLRMIRATEHLKDASEVKVEQQGRERIIEANGIPEHKVGAFPNRGNPHPIQPQSYRFELDAEPRPNRTSEPLHKEQQRGRRGAPNMPFGIAVNGVLFDPGTAEFWQGDRASGWNYCALGVAIGLGLDENHAHVQPTGAYHYHGLPTGLLDHLDLTPGEHSPLIGWAADGYPVYARYGYEKKGSKKIIDHTSSYRLKRGKRPTPPDGPGGDYDGAFVQDYEYQAGLGTLDECNGRFIHTPEFPQGTYAYFLTEAWPVIPRAFRADPISMRGSEGRPPRR